MQGGKYPQRPMPLFASTVTMLLIKPLMAPYRSSTIRLILVFPSLTLLLWLAVGMFRLLGVYIVFCLPCLPVCLFHLFILWLSTSLAYVDIDGHITIILNTILHHPLIIICALMAKNYSEHILHRVLETMANISILSHYLQLIPCNFLCYYIRNYFRLTIE